MKNRKGIILAGGTATRLFPLTLSISKQILPVYDKPMIYYPISILMLSNIRDILIISTPRDINCFKELLGDGSKFGIHFEYAIQEKPKGLAEAFIIGENFIKNNPVAMVLGDNIFYGQSLTEHLTKVSEVENFATIFGYPIVNPRAYGVVEIDNNKHVISIEEKPSNPKSNLAVPGLYFYPNDVTEIVKNLTPSSRGELEITSLNKEYMKLKRLKVELFGRGLAWFDAGTHDNLLEASNFIKTIQERQGLQIACLEEIALTNGWIDTAQLSKSVDLLSKTSYGNYLRFLINEKNF